MYIEHRGLPILRVNFTAGGSPNLQAEWVGVGGIISCALRKMKDVVTLIFVVVYRWGLGGRRGNDVLCTV